MIFDEFRQLSSKSSGISRIIWPEVVTVTPTAELPAALVIPTRQTAQISIFRRQK